MSMVPCPECHRHIRPQTSECPFCGSIQAPASKPGRVGRVSRTAWTRAAIFAGAAVLAPACGGSEPAGDTTRDSSGGDDSGGDSADEDTNGDGSDTTVAPPYGHPALDVEGYV